MAEKHLFDFHRDNWYNAAGIAFEDIKTHIQNLKRVDEMVPPGPRFYLLINFSTYQYDYVGRGQYLLTGYENELVQKEGIQFQISNMHPEDGEYIVKNCYPTFNEILASYPFEEQKNILLQSNYRFRHKKGHYVHIMEQMWVMKSDEQGNYQTLLVHVYELPMTQPFKVNVLVKKLKPDQTYELLYSAEFPEKKENTLLSKREREVICLLADGCSSQEIADRLFISYHTVNTHRKNILQKLEMKSTSEVIAFGITQGII